MSMEPTQETLHRFANPQIGGGLMPGAIINSTAGNANSSGSPPLPVTSLHSQLMAGQPQLPPPVQMDPLRLQQHLYTLALADRMRMLQPAFNGGVCNPFASMFLPGSAGLTHLAAAQAQAHRFSPPSDLARFPLAKLDPRLFRIPFPEEPKPQHSYIGLIAIAILSSSEKKLVLADIYQYILDNFPYFRHRGPGWRNSIRHNLSLNDCFIKAGRASNGKGHFWAVHPACQDDFQKGDFSRRKAQRKVRKYLGLNVEEEEEDTPPISPPPSMLSPPPSLLSPVSSTSLPLQPFSFLQATAAMAADTANIFRLPPVSAAIKEESPNSLMTQQPSTQRFSFGIDCILGRVAAEARNNQLSSARSSPHNNDEENDDLDDSKSDIEVGVDENCSDYETEQNSPFLPTVSC